MTHQEAGRKGGLATAAGRTPKERSAFSRRGALATNSARTPEQRSEVARKAALAMWEKLNADQVAKFEYQGKQSDIRRANDDRRIYAQLTSEGVL